MIDFKRMKREITQEKVIDPRLLFERLPKPAHVNDLYQSQADVLEEWFSNRNQVSEAVVKLHTGGGKTLVGLLMALSSAAELQMGSLYLVDNKQLASQVVDEANAIGINACLYNGRKSISSSFLKGESILVGAYQSLFNGLTSFGLLGRSTFVDVGTIIFDDAHACFSVIRDAFTVTIDADEDEALFKKICSPFRKDFEKADRGTTFNDFMAGVGSTGSEAMEVPFWAWLEHVDETAKMLSEAAKKINRSDDKTSESLKFSWPLIKDELRYCRAIITPRQLSITPYLPLVDKFPSYTKASRKIYMSATFSDDSEIIRSFEPVNDVVPRTYTSDTLAGVGRRLILPARGDVLDDAKLFSLLEENAAAKKGSVIIAPSEKAAQKWIKNGAVLTDKSSIEEMVRFLKAGSIDKPIVFVNRYNGIDLPNDACRLLVIDGMPQGITPYDKIMSINLQDSCLIAHELAHSIEQGVGRGTRGSGDFCAVVLYGDDLCNWIDTPKNAKLFTLPTQAQFACGAKIMDNIDGPDEFIDTLKLGIAGDPDFSSFLSDYTAQYLTKSSACTDDGLSSFAQVERRAFRLWRSMGSAKAIDTIKKYISCEDNDSGLRSYLMQMGAQILHAEGEFDISYRMYRSAYAINRSLVKPRSFLKVAEPSIQASKVLDQVKRFLIDGKGIEEFDRKTIGMESKNYKEFELSVEWLGTALGFESKRFDNNGKGSDVLWRCFEDGFGIIFEAKSGKKEDNPFDKSEHGQLHVAEKWFKSTFPESECAIVSLHHNAIAYDNASAESTRVITIDAMREVRNAARDLWMEVAGSALTDAERLAECERLLDELGLRRTGLLERYSQFFESV